MVLNNKSFEKAQKLISEGKVDTECTHWHECMPNITEENTFIDKHGWYEYSLWFLGIEHMGVEDQTEFDAGRNIPQEKLKYKYYFGNFEKVYLSALHDTLREAKDLEYTDIVEAAEKLIKLVEG